MTKANRNISDDRRATIAVIQGREAIWRGNKTWLGHKSITGELDEALVRGATRAELARIRPSYRRHLEDLLPDHGLKVTKPDKGGRIFFDFEDLGLGRAQVVLSRRQDAEEDDSSGSFWEGALKRVTVNAFERNDAARKACIEHYGVRCVACSVSLVEIYGHIAEGFIHVHHLKCLSEIRKGYVVDPIDDLRPVCPNCHAIIHRTDPPLTIEELKMKMSLTKRLSQLR